MFCHTPKNSSVFDSPCSNSPDKQDLPDDDNSTDNDDQNDVAEISEENPTNFIHRLEEKSEVIVVKPHLNVRHCVTTKTYEHLSNTHVIKVNHPTLKSGECVTKRQIYMNEPYLSTDIPVRTRIFDRRLSLLGFVAERPCPSTNDNRFLILYDDFTAAYHSTSESFHLCFCQDFRRHLLNIESKDLRTFYRKVFHQTDSSIQRKFSLHQIIRVRKFDSNFHNARILQIDHSIMKICFYERKSQKEIWIHNDASIIDSSSPTESLRLRKRKDSSSPMTTKTKKFSSTIDENVRANLVTSYYTNILLPKFRLLNVLPFSVHQCSRECVASAEEKFSPRQIIGNPFLLPFECRWSIVDSKPRGYRTPCRRTLFSLDDIDQYLHRTNSKLSIKFFIDGVLTRFQPPMNEFEKKYFVSDDLSNGLENVTISVYNDVDSDRPETFHYVTANRPVDQRIRKAMNEKNPTKICCDCLDNCNDRTKCACFQQTLVQARLYRDPMIVEKEKHCSDRSYVLKTIGYQRKRLFNPISTGIYECHEKCSCHREHCGNRLVQQGLFLQLQLFKDKNKGWGLRTLHDLPRGTFICQYIGEILTSEQGHERAQTMDDKYQTSLDLIKQIRSDEEPYVIDGSVFSNLGRYFNHSCDPNMFIQNVFIDSHDLHFPNLALFAQTHIKAGQELTWHYNCELLLDREVKCCCGSKNCRGRLL